MKELKKQEVRISLDPWGMQYINNLLKTGGYKSISEIIREALRVHQDSMHRVKVIPIGQEELF